MRTPRASPGFVLLFSQALDQNTPMAKKAAKKKVNRGGRPRLGSEPKGPALSVRLAASERDACERAAEEAGYAKVSTWLRDVLLRAANRR